MGRKRKRKDKMKYWCFYCDRRFKDEKVLTQHQKLKHFKCFICHKRLVSASGLKIHALQIHKHQLQTVPNAIKGRDSFEYSIYGMEGIPKHFLEKYNIKSNNSGLPKKKQKVKETVNPATNNLNQNNGSVNNSSIIDPESLLNVAKNNLVLNSSLIGINKSPSTKPKQKKQFMIWNDDEYSMEERRAQFMIQKLS